MTGKIEPKDHLERVALFRMQVLGPLLNRELVRGELLAGFKQLAEKRYRPPGANRTRTYGMSTIQRWYFAWKRDGLDGLRPKPRKLGDARALTEEQRDLVLAIRREYPSMPATVIVDTLEGDGRLNKGQVSVGSVRRLLRAHQLGRKSRHSLLRPDGERLRWEAGFVGELWHSDVCHGTPIFVNGRSTPVRIHALMDDKSRFVPVLRLFEDEREVRMLEILLEAIRHYGAPRRLFLDNGSTYSGEALETACGRLGIALSHAKPYDPQARGKMERFWRTMRERCLDYIQSAPSLHAIQVRLTAWLSEWYSKRSHAALIGQSPAQRWSERTLERIDEASLESALTVRQNRKVRADCPLSVGGVDWELSEVFLAGQIVTVGRTLADAQRAPWVEHEDQRYELHVVDPVANGKLRRPRRKPKPGVDAIEFDPPTVLLERMMRRGSTNDSKCGGRQ